MIETYGKHTFFNKGVIGKIRNKIGSNIIKINNQYVKTVSTKRLIFIVFALFFIFSTPIKYFKLIQPINHKLNNLLLWGLK